jgi:hypothetical protein
MFDHVLDPVMPALQRLTPADLARITGAPGTRLLRARYKPGARAVLHVGMAGQEGSIWFFAGDKALKLAHRLPEARHDATTGALFQAFPQDHRMPLLANFVAFAMVLAPQLIGGRALSPPQLMRYRPGLSATFRWTRHDGRVFFIKQTPDNPVAAQAVSVAQMQDAAVGTGLAFAPVAGTLPHLGLIAYHSAKGQPLDAMLPGGPALQAGHAMAQVVQALRNLWSMPIVPGRVLDRAALIARAVQASQMIALLDPQTGLETAQLVAGLEARAARVRLRPIHADMKLEHAFLSGPETTLIDMESLSLGDPDYDLAKLDARLAMAEIMGQIPASHAAAARSEVLRHVGPDYPWFLTCARLQTAKFFAQRLDPATIPHMRRVLAL